MKKNAIVHVKVNETVTKSVKRTFPVWATGVNGAVVRWNEEKNRFELSENVRAREPMWVPFVWDAWFSPSDTKATIITQLTNLLALIQYKEKHT